MDLCPMSEPPLKEAFEEVKQSVSPHLILTAQPRRDGHQDHRLIAELTWNTFRDHLILEYEIPKYDGDRARRFRALAGGNVREENRPDLEMFRSQNGKDGSSERRSRRSCGCEEWSATLPAVTLGLLCRKPASE